MKTMTLKDFPEDVHRKAKSNRELIIRAITEYIKKAN